MNNKILRESLIIFLLVIVIMFTLGILFYDYIPTTKDDISSVQYVTDENVEQVLNEIQTNSGIDIKSEVTDSPLKSYTITADDLNVYATENYYESGKKDPFAEYSDPVEETVRTTTTTGTANNSQGSNPIYTEEPKKVEDKVEDKNAETVNKEIPQNKDVSSLLDELGSKTENTSSVEEDKKVDNSKNENTSTTGTFFEKEDSK